MIERLFFEQAEKRPLSDIQDYVMLAAEKNLGGRKTDFPHCLTAIKNEMAALPQYAGEEALYERLDGGLCRLNLRMALRRGLTAQEIAKAHFDFISRFQADTAQFRRDLNILSDLCDQDELPIDCVMASFYLKTLGRVDAGKCRHSAAYILHYKPAYRVVFTSAVKQLARGGEGR